MPNHPDPPFDPSAAAGPAAAASPAACCAAAGKPEQPHRRRLAAAALGAAALLSWAGPAALAQQGGAAKAAAPKPAPRPKPARRAAAPASAPAGASYAGRTEAAAFAGEVAERYGLPRADIEAALAQARRQEAVRRAIMPPPAGSKKNWGAYRARFVEPLRIGVGLEFWQRHGALLERAAERWGVPAAIIVGIIGVETFYGRDMGRFRVIDALATLAFDFPSGRSDRSGYFREQLAYYFAWCAREQADPLSVRGSYAGAIGLPQFMPESIMKYATDFDGDGHIDLIGSVADAIGSVARFLAEHGWVRGLQPALAVDVDRANLQRLTEPDIVPSFDAQQLLEHGAQPLEQLPAGEKFAVVELENAGARSHYVLGTQNFYVLTRYNRSSYYALAVLDLGAAVEARRRAG
jgi:membrane-bound lytic murein transglycosylase B